MNTTLIIIIATVVVVVFLIATQANVEAFTCDYPSYCTTCPELNRKKCNNCINCGYCITPSGKGECVAGDENGPLFREDCVAYEYSNPLYACDADPDYFFNYLYYYHPELFVQIPRIYGDYYGHHDHHDAGTQTDTNNSPPSLPPPKFPKPPRIPRQPRIPRRPRSLRKK